MAAPDPASSGLDPQWVRPEGLYKARVDLGEGDFAVVCAVSRGPVQRELDILLDLGDSVLSLGDEADPQAMFAAIRAKLDGETQGKLWRLVDDLIVHSLVEWHVPAIAALPAFGGNEPPAPTVTLDEAARQEVLDNLPLDALARLLLGVVWHLKNSLGGLRLPAPA